MKIQSDEKAARCGLPSFVWRAGQERRLQMILQDAGKCIEGRLLEDGCGVGIYLHQLSKVTGSAFGLEYDFERAAQARQEETPVVCAAAEAVPFPSRTFDVILSHEVIEHVQDDRRAVEEMVRLLRPGGKIILFCPNRGYPFETHGIYWRGQYHFGNIPLVNYLPRWLRDRLAPHVRVYSRGDLERLFAGLPVFFIKRTIIFGGYDNIILRWPRLGKILRWILQALENTPLRRLGLSHYWVVEAAGGKRKS